MPKSFVNFYLSLEIHITATLLASPFIGTTWLMLVCRCLITYNTNK